MGRKRSDHIPPYVSYRTFTNFLTELKAQGLPSRLDRSVMAHKSGTIQSQLLLTLRYLGLVSSSGQPTERLKKLLASQASARKALLQEIIRSSYHMVFASEFGLSSATSHQAEELFQQTGASGETLRRCLAFFLAAAKDSGIPVSPYIRPHRRARTGSKKRDSTAISPARPGSSEVHAKSVQLKSGGGLSLELSLNVFDLDREDREFVFGLIDRLRDYEEENRREKPEENREGPNSPSA